MRICIHDDRFDRETIEILGLDYTILPNEEDQIDAVMVRIKSDMLEGIYTHVSLDDIFMAACRAGPSLIEIVRLNYQEMYNDIHEISDCYDVIINDQPYEIFVSI